MSDNLPLSPDQVSQVLRRAAEIDVSRDSFSEAELIRVAVEAGIAPQAVQAALQEVRQQEGSAVPTTVQGAAQPAILRSMALNSLGGAGLGFLAVSEPTFTIAVAGTALLAMLFRAVQQTGRGQLQYQLGNAAAWLSVFIGGSVGAWPDAEDLVFPVLILWLVASVIGLIVGRVRGGSAAAP